VAESSETSADRGPAVLAPLLRSRRLRRIARHAGAQGLVVLRKLAGVVIAALRHRAVAGRVVAAVRRTAAVGPTVEANTDN
jgi:hypothetical protein